MDKMTKEVMAVRVSPVTKKKLQALRKVSGQPYGVIIDTLVSQIRITEDWWMTITTPYDNVSDAPFTDEDFKAEGWKENEINN